MPWTDKNDALNKIYNKCTLCPRNCNADRSEAAGYCGAGAKIRAARAGLHIYEEPFISGSGGSGTVFFSGCSMKCVFCQNIELSRDSKGFDISIERLAEIFLKLQEKGAENINLVTGTHFTPSIAAALRLAKEEGLAIPAVWNSSGYEKRETLELLKGLVDIWIPDLKTLSPDTGRRYFNAPDYPEYAMEAISFMVNESNLSFEGELLKSGVVVRHLMMPKGLKDTKRVLRYLHESFGDRIWISLMNQYTVMGEMPYPELNKSLTKKEYDRAVDYAIELGIQQCLIQEGGTVSDSFIPAFDGTGIIK